MIRRLVPLFSLSLWLSLSVSGRAEVWIDTVLVGNPGNAADSTGYGAVDYVYAIGKYEVTAGQYTAFLNAVAATDTYKLYSTSMWSMGYGCKIQQSGVSGSYTYSVAPDRANRPVNYVSWGDAARFTNWLHNGQPTGAQDLTTTEDGAYYLNGVTAHAALMAVTRSANAKYGIPSENEWYKAAYHKNDGITGNYFDYPTGSDSRPRNDLTNPDPGNSANFLIGSSDYTIGSPYYMTEVGEFENSVSAYGTFDQGGNIWEWNEAAIASTERCIRGGDFSREFDRLLATDRAGDAPGNNYYHIGFRVTSVPEPSAWVLACLGVLSVMLIRWRHMWQVCRRAPRCS